MSDDTPATSIIRFSKEQVEAAMWSVVEDLQSDWPDEEQALHVAEALGDLFERNLIRDHVLPRIQDSIDLNWLRANEVPYAIKSSVNQFVGGHYIRIQISQEAHRVAWRKWRET